MNRRLFIRSKRVWYDEFSQADLTSLRIVAKHLPREALRQSIRRECFKSSRPGAFIIFKNAAGQHDFAAAGILEQIEHERQPMGIIFNSGSDIEVGTFVVGGFGGMMAEQIPIAFLDQLQEPIVTEGNAEDGTTNIG